MGEIVTGDQRNRSGTGVRTLHQQGGDKGHRRRHRIGHGVAAQILDDGVLEGTVVPGELVALLRDRQGDQLQGVSTCDPGDATEIVSTSVGQSFADGGDGSEVSVAISMGSDSQGQQVMVAKATIEALRTPLRNDSDAALFRSRIHDVLSQSSDVDAEQVSGTNMHPARMIMGLTTHSFDIEGGNADAGIRQYGTTQRIETEFHDMSSGSEPEDVGGLLHDESVSNLNRLVQVEPA